VLVQEVIAAMSTSPCPMSTGIFIWWTSCAGTRSGVGRLVIISASVSGFVSFRVRPFRTTSGAVSGACSPPPVTCGMGWRGSTIWW